MIPLWSAVMALVLYQVTDEFRTNPSELLSKTLTVAMATQMPPVSPVSSSRRTPRWRMTPAPVQVAIRFWSNILKQLRMDETKRTREESPCSTRGNIGGTFHLIIIFYHFSSLFFVILAFLFFLLYDIRCFFSCSWLCVLTDRDAA